MQVSATYRNAGKRTQHHIGVAMGERYRGTLDFEGTEAEARALVALRNGATSLLKNARDFLLARDTGAVRASNSRQEYDAVQRLRASVAASALDDTSAKATAE